MRSPRHPPFRGGLLALVMLAWAAFPLAAQAPAIDFDKLRDEAAQRLSEYLRISSTNPPGNEVATARWLKDVLAREGIEGQILDTAELGPGRANFYARVPGATPGHAIALVHHLDVVPVVKDGSVWGRGALDMKGHGIIQPLSLDTTAFRDPWLVELEENRMEVHGNDERVSVENLGFGLRLYTGILLEMQR